MNRVNSYITGLTVSFLLLFSSVLISLFIIIPFQSEAEDFIFPISTLEEQGIDSVEIDSIIDFIDQNDYAIDSMVIVRNGNLVLEKYLSLEAYTNYVVQGKREAHLIASCTKTVTSALIGIALERGYLDNLSQKVVDFFTDRTIKNLDDRKKNVTIEDLLTMRAGFKWYQPFSTESGYKDPSADHNMMARSIDYTQYVLDQPMVLDPGTGWDYSNGNSHLLSAIIQKVTRMTTLEFGQKFLFEPLDMYVLSWNNGPEGVTTGAAGLRLTPIDMAKFGLLYLMGWRTNHIKELCSGLNNFSSSIYSGS
ncbi:MAG: serine hydrolase domain-containing protein [Candidatus Hodarchaeales archaeon]